jgi:hypothetical protein
MDVECLGKSMKQHTNGAVFLKKAMVIQLAKPRSYTLVACMAYTLTLKMEAVSYSEIPASYTAALREFKSNTRLFIRGVQVEDSATLRGAVWQIS